jgi:glycosyltransferase involved in cell wall biosynthesis
VFREVEVWHLGEKLRRARFACCISSFTRSQCLPWVPPERWGALHVVHCGVDPGMYAPRSHQGPGTELLFVGRPSVWKGFPFLIEAFARLRAERPDLRLTVVGDGPERREQEARVRAQGLGDAVVFTGYQSQKQVADWLGKADALVLPSLIEGVPVVLMEAGAAGLPVVATNVGGVSELVRDGVSGFLVPPGSAEVLLPPLRALLDDPELRARMGGAGREAVARDFDATREAGRLRHILAAVLAVERRA